MSQELPPLSIPDMERILREKQDRLLDLIQQRDVVQKELDRIDRELVKVMTLNAPVGISRRREKNEVPLRVVVQNILKRHTKGLTLAELTEKVAASGFKTTSQSFSAVVYQSVYQAEEIVYDRKTSRYRVER